MLQIIPTYKLCSMTYHFLLVLHSSHLGFYPSENYDMQQLPIFIQKPLTQNPLYYTTCREFHNWK